MLFWLLHHLAAVAQPQPLWKVTLNKKTVLSGDHYDDSVVNQVLVTKKDLSNNGLFKIEFADKRSNEPNGWIRTLALLESNQAEIAKKDSTAELAIPCKDLLKLLWLRKKLMLYTWSAPLDPAIAAAIRIRRYRICDIILTD